MVRGSGGQQDPDSLRQVRRFTLLSVVILAAGVIAVVTGAVLIGIVAILIGLASLLLWSAIWIGSRRPAQPTGSGRSPGRDVPVVVSVAVILIGLASLALFVFALTSWDTTGLATRARYSQPMALAASAIGTALFGGGGVLLLVRRVRGQRGTPPE
ncbi:hypothetical protein [Ruania zhangjianzhongii]|uniref:hypothetical protein n=1 Tax=Ruania zhangjianzhongii TaxID=2603206 RepID=UPI0011CAEA22|nr:hypothetical protein [Ruania zhangjianzhongii]